MSQNFFRFEVFASFRFVFASFNFRFVSDAKKQKTLFRIKEKNISLPFCFISFHFTSKRKWWKFSILFRFVVTLFHFRFASNIYLSHRCETSEKKLFFASKRKKNFASVSLHFASKRKWQRTLTPSWVNKFQNVSCWSWTYFDVQRFLVSLKIKDD